MTSPHVAPGSAPLRVLFVLDSLGAGGAERSTAVLLPMLGERGISASVATLYRAAEGSEDDVRASGIEVAVLPPGRFVRRVRELRAIIRRERPDVVYSALFAADHVARFACIGLRTPVIAAFVNVPRRATGPTAAKPGGWRVRVVNLVDAVTGHLLVDHFHAVTPGVARLHTAAYRIPARRISVVERGRDTDALGARTTERRAAVRAALGIAPDAPVLVAAGRIEHAKAHVDLVRAADELAVSFPDLVVLIAGRAGNASPAVEAELARLPRAGRHVRLLGHRPDVADLLSASDVMVLPSLYEGTAGIALEAMCLGTPIVSSRLEGMDGILVDGQNALIFEPGDVAGMSACIEQMLRHRAMADRLAAAGSVDFAARFTLDRSADNMAALFRTVAGGPPHVARPAAEAAGVSAAAGKG